MHTIHCFTQGEYAKAEPLYQRALTIREKALGLDHPYVAGTLTNLGQVLADHVRVCDNWLI